MTIRELKGLRAVKALNSYSLLLLGLSFTPLNEEKSSKEFLEKFQELPEDEKRKYLRYACTVVRLDEDDIESLTYFASDENGIAYEKPALAALSPSEIAEIMVEVALKISGIKLFF